MPSANAGEVESLLDRLNVPYSIDPGKEWPHAPTHCLSEHGTFIVTGSTLGKEHYFRGPDRLSLLEEKLLRLARQYEITLAAWSVFSNHYHFIAHTNAAVNPIAECLAQLHSDTATELNRDDPTSGRQIWFNYWDTQLTFEKSYLARLHYVHQNPVKHGLVRCAAEYRWCSAAWFERTATKAQIETIYSFKIDRVKIEDDYEPIL